MIDEQTVAIANDSKLAAAAALRASLSLSLVPLSISLPLYLSPRLPLAPPHSPLLLSLSGCSCLSSSSFRENEKVEISTIQVRVLRSLSAYVSRAWQVGRRTMESTTPHHHPSLPLES